MEIFRVPCQKLFSVAMILILDFKNALSLFQK